LGSLRYKYRSQVNLSVSATEGTWSVHPVDGKVRRSEAEARQLTQVLLGQVWITVRDIRPTTQDIEDGIWDPNPNGLYQELAPPRLYLDECEMDQYQAAGRWDGNAIMLDLRFARNLPVRNLIFLLTHETMHAVGFAHRRRGTLGIYNKKAVALARLVAKKGV